MMLFNNDNKHIIKILRICALLDEDYRARQGDHKRLVATMFYLASQHIKAAFGHKVEPKREGQDAIYALSGFKQPIEGLFAEYLASTDHEDAENIRLVLIELANYLDNHFHDITNRPRLADERLANDATLQLANL